ncbi:MAG: hypothetical protein Tsb0010_03210 [Parvularculaceae bacterium]
MNLGAFSVSLAVKDIAASKAFYQKIGFEPFAGEEENGWLILSCGDCKIGLFQDKFEKNILTFNPGWSQNAEPLDTFEDVREIQKRLKEAGLRFDKEADETSSGPASFVVTDPDGNHILFDQHV